MYSYTITIKLNTLFQNGRFQGKMHPENDAGEVGDYDGRLASCSNKKFLSTIAVL